MLKAEAIHYQLNFKHPATTSRGTITKKETWFIRIWEEARPDIAGLGECSTLRGLSIEDRPGYEEKIHEVCENIDDYWYYLEEGLTEWPSIQFGLEMALLDLQKGGKRLLFPSKFTRGEQAITINGLIWMGDTEFMWQQIKEKVKAGFHCIKLKIGALNFEEEYRLLQKIRKTLNSKTLELRVDANGAFSVEDALAILKHLAKLQIHSIEQPIKKGQWEDMARLCERTPVPVALDEELIGVSNLKQKKELLDTIRPQYIILKPSLVGGFKGSREWIELANERKIPWWITSALESNVGLNAIAQWTYTLNNPMPQGLGTGELYFNNIPSPLKVKGNCLYYHPEKQWDVSSIQ